MIHVPTRFGRFPGIIVETAKGRPEPLSGLKNNQVVEAPSPSSSNAGYLADLKILDRAGPFTHLLQLIKDTPLEKNTNRGVERLIDRVLTDKERGSHPAAKMEAALRRMALKIDGIGGEELKELIKKSGLIWENKLSKVLINSGKTGYQAPLMEDLVQNDLKARVMHMVRHTSHQEGETVRSLSSFVDSLEKLQIFNSHSGDESGKYLLPFPYISEDVLKFGQLFIDKGGSGERGGRTTNRLVRVAFILEMSRLGNIRADFSILKKAVSGEFQVETPRAGETVSRLIPSLVDELEKKGYMVKKAECTVVNPLALKGTPLTEMIDSDNKGKVNIVI